MEGNRNMELNDEMVGKATGGKAEDVPAPKFNVGDKVIYVTDNSELIIESRTFAEGPYVSYWIYVARDPEHKNRFVSGADKLFRLA